ncbi:MAG: LytTR family DNA-binding domain-containing protein [Bacteroidota bacterium]
MKVLIADDEALARRRIVTLLDETNFDLTLLEASNGKETIDILVNDKPDLLFLDIKMTDMSGFDVLRQLPSEEIPRVIFVTAFDDFAVKAFEVQAIDFLLKPYKKDRFYEAFHRAVQQMELAYQGEFQEKIKRFMSAMEEGSFDALHIQSNFLEKVVLKVNKRYIFVPVDSIKYVRSSSYYAEIHTEKEEKHLYRTSLTEFCKKLDPKQFVRVNRSTILNIRCIQEVVSEGQGDYSVVMVDRTSYVVSKSYRYAFLTLLGIK